MVLPRKEKADFMAEPVGSWVLESELDQAMQDFHRLAGPVVVTYTRPQPPKEGARKRKQRSFSAGAPVASRGGGHPSSRMQLGGSWGRSLISV